MKDASCWWVGKTQALGGKQFPEQRAMGMSRLSDM